MTAKKCGEFIAILRKEKELTQKQLADALSVSDKAVSRWETGKGFPDVTSLVNLSEFFGVTVNEVLAGERVPPENLPDLADKNILNAMESNEKHKKQGLIQTVLAIIVFVAVMIPPIVEIIKEIINLKPIIDGDNLIGFTVQIVVSICLVGTGISVRLGNVSLIHSYHYTRVTDQEGYCKAMSVPMVFMGIIIALGGAVMLLSSVHTVAEIIGTIITLGGCCTCVIWIFKVQMKYNGGLF